jgi:hypothetical protein
MRGVLITNRKYAMHTYKIALDDSTANKQVVVGNENCAANINTVVSSELVTIRANYIKCLRD